MSRPWLTAARTIVVARVQPVQYLPMLAGDEMAELRAAIGGLASGANAALTDALLALKPTLPAGANIILVDQEAFFRHVTPAARVGTLDIALGPRSRGDDRQPDHVVLDRLALSRTGSAPASQPNAGRRPLRT